MKIIDTATAPWLDQPN